MTTINMAKKDDSFVPELESSIDEDTANESVSLKIKRARIEYNFCQIFENAVDAKEILRTEACWGTKNRSNSDEGEKVFYRCNRVKARGEQCKASLYLLYDATSARGMLYRSDLDHNCDTIRTKTGSSMTPEVTKIIEEFCDQKKTLLTIINHLTVLNLPVPKKYQISNHIAKYRKSKYGATTISRTELRAMLQAYTGIPESSETPFVLYDEEADEETFRFFFTSNSLIAKAKAGNHWHADGTYKLLWQGFPVLIVGTTDMNRKFHIIGVAVCTNEKEIDFAFLFRSVKKSAELLLGAILKPQVLVSDA